MDKFEKANKNRLSLDKKALPIIGMFDKILGIEQTLDAMIQFKNISLETAENNIDGWTDFHATTFEFMEEYEELLYIDNIPKKEEMKRAYADILDYFFNELLPDIQDM